MKISFLRDVGLVGQPHLDSRWTQRALQREGEARWIPGPELVLGFCGHCHFHWVND